MRAMIYVNWRDAFDRHAWWDDQRGLLRVNNAGRRSWTFTHVPLAVQHAFLY
jgi:hypothetical protein